MARLRFFFIGRVDKRIEVFVLKLGNYLKTFWPTLTNALEVYDGLIASLAENTSNEKSGVINDYFEYYKQDVLDAGLRSGKFVQGRLNVNKHHASLEAFVSRSSVQTTKGK